jgi:hypothetical protein
MFIRILAAALLCALFTVPAQARHRHKPAPQLAPECFTIMPCAGAVRPSSNFLDGVRSIRVTMKRERIASISITAASRVIGGRLAGCPSRFCGCGASLHLFGRIIPTLNLAANWLRFPRASPAPKMAAARRGHVFVLEEHISGDTWLVYDANSGGSRTRLHPRSIAGFAIVDPSGAV